MPTHRQLATCPELDWAERGAGRRAPAGRRPGAPARAAPARAYLRLSLAEFYSFLDFYHLYILKKKFKDLIELVKDIRIACVPHQSIPGLTSPPLISRPPPKSLSSLHQLPYGKVVSSGLERYEIPHRSDITFTLPNMHAGQRSTLILRRRGGWLDSRTNPLPNWSDVRRSGCGCVHFFSLPKWVGDGDGCFRVFCIIYYMLLAVTGAGIKEGESGGGYGS